jgi:hypothetical protein
VLLAVFFPTLARQLVSDTLIASIVIVLVVWALWYVLVTRPRRPKGETPPEPLGPSIWSGLKAILRRKPKAAKAAEAKAAPAEGEKPVGGEPHDPSSGGGAGNA